jgi:dipeptidyl aminopeptidase/acylaminoacyl peptidase
MNSNITLSAARSATRPLWRQHLRHSATALLLSMLCLSVGEAQSTRERRSAPIDTARARQLYVSNRHEDHPQGNFVEQMEEKRRTDSIFTARSVGVMRFRKVTYRSSADTLQIPAYIFEPLTVRGPRQHAAMVWVHGGVHGDMDEAYLPFIIEAVQRGYVIIAPDYRGSTGHGAAFYNAIDYGGFEVDDVESAVGVLRDIPAVDTARIGVMGWSHGGFITAHLLFRGSKTPFRAGAAIVPVTNLVFRLSYKGPSYQRSFSTQPRLSGLPFEKRQEYIRRSPYYHVDSLQRPILVHVATNDEDVNFEESRPLVDALLARKPALSETKIYVNPTPGPTSGGHTFSRRVDRKTLLRDDSPEQVDAWNHIWRFFEQHLGK